MGEPGGGKSHILKTVLELFCPEEYLVEVSRLTENSLFYLGPRELQGKVLHLHQFEGMQGFGEILAEEVDWCLHQ